MHFAESLDGLTEVFESGLTDYKVEGVWRKRHLGRIAVAELDRHACVLRAGRCHLHERLADVQTKNPISAQFGQLDGQVSGAGGHFEYAAAAGNLTGHELGGLAVIPACCVSGIPAGDKSLHWQALVTFPALRRQNGGHNATPPDTLTVCVPPASFTSREIPPYRCSSTE